MKTKILIAILASFLVISVVAAGMIIPANEKGKEKAKAPENSAAIEKVQADLVSTPPGLEKKPPGLEKIVFIHYRKGHGRPPWAGGGKPKKESKCYDFLGRGIKWKNEDLSIDYVINPDNPDDLTEDFVTSAILAGAEEWDYYTTTELFTNGFTVSDSVTAGIQDYTNVLSFGNYPTPGVIAVTTVWGYFSGPPGWRRIVEFDILFDTDFVWGDATDSETPDVMDLQNIATHELGHGVGLADIYDTGCSEVTMYGYSDYEEIKKRDLEPADITGLQKLYGE